MGWDGPPDSRERFNHRHRPLRQPCGGKVNGRLPSPNDNGQRSRQHVRFRRMDRLDSAHEPDRAQKVLDGIVRPARRPAVQKEAALQSLGAQLSELSEMSHVFRTDI